MICHPDLNFSYFCTKCGSIWGSLIKTSACWDFPSVVIPFRLRISAEPPWGRSRGTGWRWGERSSGCLRRPCSGWRAAVRWRVGQRCLKQTPAPSGQSGAEQRLQCSSLWNKLTVITVGQTLSGRRHRITIIFWNWDRWSCHMPGNGVWWGFCKHSQQKNQKHSFKRHLNIVQTLNTIV